MTEKSGLDEKIKTVRASEKKFFKMGEVGDLTELEPHVLRFWESEFSSLNPKKNRSGHRIFSKEDVELVLRIKELLYNHGFTIAGAQKKLSGGDEIPQVEGPSTIPQAPVVKALREVETILQDTLKLLDGP